MGKVTLHCKCLFQAQEVGQGHVSPLRPWPWQCRCACLVSAFTLYGRVFLDLGLTALFDYKSLHGSLFLDPVPSTWFLPK